jgi:hypothetical protein
MAGNNHGYFLAAKQALRLYLEINRKEGDQPL